MHYRTNLIYWRISTTLPIIVVDIRKEYLLVNKDSFGIQRNEEKRLSNIDGVGSLKKNLWLHFISI